MSRLRKINISTGADCALTTEHELDRALCADLERLADGLPRLPPNSDVRRLCERLLAASERWSDPKWAETFGESPAWQARLTDSLHAEDVVDAIWGHWRAPTGASTGQLSYMLRALFDGRRRAIALEEAQLGCANCQSSAMD